MTFIDIYQEHVHPKTTVIPKDTSTCFTPPFVSLIGKSLEKLMEEAAGNQSFLKQELCVINIINIYFKVSETGQNII